MRNFGRWLRTAVCISIGMFTNPNDSEPFHRGRPGRFSPFSAFLVAFRRVFMAAFSFELALGLDPVVDVPARPSAALEIAVIRAQPDIFLARLRRHGFGLR